MFACCFADNPHGLLEKDSVKNFVTLPSCNEDEAIFETPLKILAALFRRRAKYALYWRQEVSMGRSCKSPRLRCLWLRLFSCSPASCGPSVEVSPVHCEPHSPECRNSSGSLYGSICALQVEILSLVALLNATSLFLHQVTSTSALWITCAGSEALEGTRCWHSLVFLQNSKIAPSCRGVETSRLCG